MSNHEIEDADFPPMSPGDEPPAPDDQKFVADCLASLGMLGGLGEITAGVHSLTENQTWGPVFRVDYTMNQAPSPGLINRLVGWRRPNGSLGTMFAIGQDLPPLGAG